MRTALAVVTSLAFAVRGRRLRSEQSDYSRASCASRRARRGATLEFSCEHMMQDRSERCGVECILKTLALPLSVFTPAVAWRLGSFRQARKSQKSRRHRRTQILLRGADENLAPNVMQVLSRRTLFLATPSAIMAGLLQKALPASAQVVLEKPAKAVPAAVSRLPAPERLIAVGDLHGDCKAFVRVLQRAGLYDPAKGQWTGGKTVLVQIGDVLDRGSEELELLELLRKLKKQSAAEGGAVITLLGNHEVLNAAGISIYAAPDSSIPNRAEAFNVGGPLAAELASWPVVCVVGDTAFVHAGLTESLCTAGIEAVNAEATEWLLKGSTNKPPEMLLPVTSRQYSPRSPVWMRDLSDPPMGEPSPVACSDLQRFLSRLGAKRVVVGHTVQPKISCACDCSVFRIDVGLSVAMRSGPTQALEILRDGSVKVLA